MKTTTGPDATVIRMRQALDPFRLLLISVAGWFNQQQWDALDYLREENRVLREQLGNKRLRLNDDRQEVRWQCTTWSKTTSDAG
jgi:hypothetical protein